MTRLTWDNAALMSPATAEKLGVKSEDVVRLKYEGRELEAPVYVMPGQADGTVALPLGYGRTAAGKVGGSLADGIPPVGFNAYLLRTSKAMDFGTGLWVEPTGRKHALATAQEQFAIDAVGLAARLKRVPELVREATLAEYKKDPKFARKLVEHPPLRSLWQPPGYTGHRWGMTIDLSKCIGCGTCVVACQAENNIPVVGKERVLAGRQMQWLRIDRYFRGPAASPQVVFQPVACQHCELAPCEEVCPVAATVHSAEGLNVMVYNRCVGTRYCSNNCPYKVRRFNYFNYHKDLEDPANEVAKMANNPDVTVRSRGVMEKCTYCVQRIERAKIEAKNERRPLADGQIKTACQQACPTQAITFGDLADATSAVAHCAAADRAYAMLAELNVKPRTAYLARIRNPNPELEKDHKKGATD
jgi:molybdopterin-containing oxidoreductase family iron-sulfur binding subunit